MSALNQTRSARSVTTAGRTFTRRRSPLSATLVLPGSDLVRGELRLLRVVVLFLLAYSGLSLASMLRLIGVPGVPQFLFLSYRFLDLGVIFLFFLYSRPRVHLTPEDVGLAIFVTYPAAIGTLHEGSLMTYANDFVTFTTFAAKIVILRAVFQRIGDAVGLDNAFRFYFRRFIIWGGVIAVLALLTAVLFLRAGTQFYYQATAEVTFSAGLALAQGNIPIFLAFVVFALLAGKRMVMIGFVMMGVYAVLTSNRVKRSVRRAIVIMALLLPLLALTFFALQFEPIDFSNPAFKKLAYTADTLQSVLQNNNKILDILMFLDPVRFAEYVSLQPHLTGWQLVFGNGYGFRYDLDAAFLYQFGYDVESSVTNAHFTPLGIVAKFGLLGLAIWIFLIVRVMTAKIDCRSVLQVAARVSFFSMVVQSLFAFGFFFNLFVPFYIAVLTVRNRGTGTRSAIGGRA